MSDIVERLRRYSYRQGTEDEQGQLIHELASDLHEAADEIERLRDALEDIAGYTGRSWAKDKARKALGWDYE